MASTGTPPASAAAGQRRDLKIRKIYENTKYNPPNIDSVIVRWDKLKERK